MSALALLIAVAGFLAFSTAILRIVQVAMTMRTLTLSHSFVIEQIFVRHLMFIRVSLAETICSYQILPAFESATEFGALVKVFFNGKILITEVIE